MTKKIVKCKICEKNIVTRSKGKKFRHCGTDQPIDDCLISDLSRPKKPDSEGKKEKQKTSNVVNVEENPIKDLPDLDKNTMPEKNGKKQKKAGESKDKPDSSSEDDEDDGWE